MAATGTTRRHGGEKKLQRGSVKAVIKGTTELKEYRHHQKTRAGKKRRNKRFRPENGFIRIYEESKGKGKNYKKNGESGGEGRVINIKTFQFRRTWSLTSVKREINPINVGKFL